MIKISEYNNTYAVVSGIFEVICGQFFRENPKSIIRSENWAEFRYEIRG